MSSAEVPDGEASRESTVTSGCQCEEALSHLQEYIDCEMSEVDTVRLRAHIATCPTCLEELGVERRLRELVRRSCVERAPEHLRARVLTQITVIRASID